MFTNKKKQYYSNLLGFKNVDDFEIKIKKIMNKELYVNKIEYILNYIQLN
jgi:hypothetical protein